MTCNSTRILSAAHKGIFNEDALPLRTWIGPSGKVVRVDAFFQPGLVNDVAKLTLMWCGPGLQLAGKPKADKTGKADAAGGH